MTISNIWNSVYSRTPSTPLTTACTTRTPVTWRLSTRCATATSCTARTASTSPTAAWGSSSTQLTTTTASTQSWRRSDPSCILTRYPSTCTMRPSTTDTSTCNGLAMRRWLPSWSVFLVQKKMCTMLPRVLLNLGSVWWGRCCRKYALVYDDGRVMYRRWALFKLKKSVVKDF